MNGHEVARLCMEGGPIRVRDTARIDTTHNTVATNMLCLCILGEMSCKPTHGEITIAAQLMANLVGHASASSALMHVHRSALPAQSTCSVG